MRGSFATCRLLLLQAIVYLIHHRPRSSRAPSLLKSCRADLENAQLIFSTDMSELNINQVAMNPCFRVVRFGPHTSARSMLQFDDKT